MATKDFSSIGAGSGVFATIEQATSRKGQQGTASPDEAAARQAELRTQGRKGCKAVRINMAFTPDNHQFIKTLSKITGQTMTEFLNFVVAQYRQEHPELYERAKSIIDDINEIATNSNATEE